MDAGAYALLMENLKERRLRVGALGDIRFPRGVYVYAGGAKAGLEARIERHLDPGDKPRYHVEYLTPAMEFTFPIPFPGAPPESACELAAHIARVPGALPVLNVGTSECACLTHLYGFLDGDPDAVREAVEAWQP